YFSQDSKFQRIARRRSGRSHRHDHFPNPGKRRWRNCLRPEWQPLFGGRPGRKWRRDSRGTDRHHQTGGGHSILCRGGMTALDLLPIFAEAAPNLGAMLFAIVGIMVVIFVFLAIWAGRYTKVPPNQVLVVSGR